jgi:DNA-directed RNA polymerase subunit RPC12/RpoP
MSKQEFIERQQRMNSVWRAWVLLYMLGTMAFIAIFVILEAFPLIVVPLFAIPFLFWVIARNEKQIGIRCPHCGKSLWAKNSQIVIATGNCGHCGERILNDIRT